jgi:hypothetical protein
MDACAAHQHHYELCPFRDNAGCVIINGPWNNARGDFRAVCVCGCGHPPVIITGHPHVRLFHAGVSSVLPKACMCSMRIVTIVSIALVCETSHWRFVTAAVQHSIMAAELLSAQSCKRSILQSFVVLQQLSLFFLRGTRVGMNLYSLLIGGNILQIHKYTS